MSVFTRTKYALVTFVDVNNVWVLNGRHDLDLSSDSDEVGLCLDLALLDCLDCHLPENTLKIDITVADADEEVTSESVCADDCAV